jgi:hypothetical protein
VKAGGAFPGKRKPWTWPVGLLDPYAAGQAGYNLVAAAAVGWHAADVAAMRAQDEREAREARAEAQRAAEAARQARATMAEQGAEAQRAAMRQSADAELGRLRGAMIAAHPDRGGTSLAFIKARRIYVAARKGASNAA